MEINKVVTTEVKATDGQILNQGARVVFIDNNGNCGCGIYNGLGAKSSILIGSLIDYSVRTLKASSIKEIYLASIEIINTDKE